MEKTKLGISVGLLGAILYILGLINFLGLIVVAGYNKIVANLEEARTRLRQIAAPANAVRLNMATPCKVLGSCKDCHSDGRICCDYVVMSQQRVANRVKVILVGEQLGY